MTRSVSVWGASAVALLCAATLTLGCKKSDDKAKADDKSADKDKDKDKDKGSGAASASGSDKGSAAASAAASTTPPPGATDLAKDTSGMAAIDTSASAGAPKVDPKVHGDPTKIAPPAPPPAAAPKMHGLLSGGGGGDEAAATGFSVVYDADDGSDPTASKIEAVLRQNQVFEKIATALNSTVKMPKAIPIQFTKCGVINAFYDPSDANHPRIIICREILSYFANVFKPVAKSTDELGNGIVGALIFAFFHETGHCLIDQLQLPATGREEDAVDDFSTYVLSTNDESAQLAMMGAWWFHIQAQSGDQTPFSDEHGFDDQRFYNIMCHIYGSNTEKYKSMVDSGTLPAERAGRCEEEYRKIKRSWETLLKPYMTDQAAQQAQTTGGETAAPPPPPPPSADHQISCKDAVDHGLQLYLADLDQQSKSWTKEQIDQTVAQLKEQLPQYESKAIDECNQKNWTDEERGCLMNAKDFAAAKACD